IDISIGKKTLIWADSSKKDLLQLAGLISDYSMNITGKSTYKDEFVTAGGIDLKEVDFRTMESKLIPNLFFAGEVINIDALTGGFNFQAAWSEAWVISESIG
ncbi:MAG: NAD(P)/FAD-dependent oxidoreductase, partial [Bacteroidia bacterium]|nr:NAD(P)/FAD-dependent oxidoreductase [Bacteroidia bacterium]